MTIEPHRYAELLKASEEVQKRNAQEAALEKAQRQPKLTQSVQHKPIDWNKILHNNLTVYDTNKINSSN